jgi:SAM-dependent methyltransferase
MLLNDSRYWTPHDLPSAVALSWWSSRGDLERLRQHSAERWERIRSDLAAGGIAPPAGRVIEFGAGLGLLDDLLDATTTELVLLDHTDQYLAQRDRPLSPRARHVLWSRRALAGLQTGQFDWLVSISVFYHLDQATAVALLLELGRALRPGGKALICGWTELTYEAVRADPGKRLFDPGPSYCLDTPALESALAPEYRPLHRTTSTLVLEKVQDHP